MSKRSLFFTSAVFLILAAPLLAQTHFGTLRGAVREAGGIVPGATITLTNEATNATRSATTNNAGEYVFANVEPATYTVRLAMQGFKTIEAKGVRIGTQQSITRDFSLEVGELQESVTVEAQAAALETSNASVGTSLDKEALATLPSAGRNPFFLSVTTPGVIPSGDPQFVRQQDQTNVSLLSLGGGPRRGNNFTIDGVSIVDIRNRPSFIPSIEAVDEVKVQVNTYDAEAGRSGGGVFNTTGRSGGNEWHGSGFYQTRPKATVGKLFFEKINKSPKADTFFHLGGGSFGGPIVKNKTFFHITTEEYRTQTTRNAVNVVPTAAELNGDFSQSGVTIFDPLNVVNGVRQPFPGNVIPASRISPVANAFKKYWPAAGSSTALINDKANQVTLKLDQNWGPKAQSTLFYLWNKTEEPASRFYGKQLGDNPLDPAEGLLLRQVHAVAFNNTFIPDASTVGHVRLGYTSFADDCAPTSFDPGTLGLSSTFLGQMAIKKGTRVDIGDYGNDQSTYTFGDRDPAERTYYSWDANASVSKLMGAHTVKAGVAFRQLGLKAILFGSSAGNFTYNGVFTAATETATRRDKNILADFLLGYPSVGNISVSTPSNFFLNYYAGYVQDDYRVNSNFTMNIGLRYEFEQGLQEKKNAITVGFDRSKPWPVQVPGLNLKGGLLYAGVDGAPTHQSDPSKTKFAPRIGFAWSLNPNTVVRGGYGIFYAPHPYGGPSEAVIGTRGFTAVTDYVASVDGNRTPANTIVNPFPNGIGSPTGAANGILTGAGGSVSFVDQFRKSAYVHQFSLDLQRTLGSVVVGLGYIGSRGRHLTIGGTAAGTVNINQLDPKYLSLGAGLNTLVPNPMFGDARFGAFGRQATITQGQLLRPYPQFGDILAQQVSAGKSSYDSVVVRFDRRVQHGWGTSVNYTWSRNKDNIFGETNFFSNSISTAINAYDLDGNYGPSLLDAPHRINFSVTVELPFGKGKKMLSEPGFARVLFGGWSITALGSYQSGFPVYISQATNNSGLLTNQQRPNVTGTDPAAPGSAEKRYNAYFNPAAWSLAPAFTIGNAPRTDTRARTPFKKNTDLSIQKVESLGGRKSITLRAEVYNLFDDPLFNGPNTSFGSANFGRITSVGGFPRMLQLMARLSF
jgi:hypothetical protein